jgi:TolB-like protein
LGSTPVANPKGIRHYSSDASVEALDMTESGGEKPLTGGTANPTGGRPSQRDASDVFISYASPDLAVAERICEGLERAGVKCWIAPRDVVAGELYSAAIVHAIDATKAIVLVLSENGAASPHVLREVERASSKRHPVISIRLDRAPLPEALEYFLNTSHWLDASTVGLERTLPMLVAAVQRILASPAAAQLDHGDTSKRASELSAARDVGAQSHRHLSRALIVLSAVLALALGYFAVDRILLSQRAAPAKPVIASVPATPSFNPPPHSIAVLPFVNMSGDKEQEYFSDGLTEELLNSLARINELQVAARTSAFSFKGKDTDIGTIARKLNVGAVLEGSVRRSSHTVRITAQLINAVTGFHLWSQTYDRDLGDVLKLQSEIADAVANALKVTLLGDVAAKIELGGTHNPAAFDAYLRALKASGASHTASDSQTTIAIFTDAIRLDPNYALAFAGRSIEFNGYASEFATRTATREVFDKAKADAEQAIALTPELAEAHLALASFFENGSLDFTRAMQEYERALALAPGNARVLRRYGRFAVSIIGRSDAGIAAARRAVVLDPLDPTSHSSFSLVLFVTRHYQEALTAANEAIALDPDDPAPYSRRGMADYALGNLQSARASCEIKPDFWGNQLCLAVTYQKLARHVDAEAMLARMKTALGDAAAYQYAQIYAQWGDAPKALEWLEMALRLRDPGLADLKTDMMLDPLRQAPRFQAIERALKFPS